VIEPPQEIVEGDFELTEAAVRETARGRWFLDEFARRLRLAESKRLADALDRLEARLAAQHAVETESGQRTQRVVSLLTALVDYLNVQKDGRPAMLPELSAPEPRGAAAPSLAELDALSVADKLRLFR